MPNKQDTELLEYLRTRKNSHVRRAVQKFHAPTTPTQRRTTNASKSTNTAVKRRIEQLERKIIEQSEKNWQQQVSDVTFTTAATEPSKNHGLPMCSQS